MDTTQGIDEVTRRAYRYMGAIESGGDYSALLVTVKAGGKAEVSYGIMQANMQVGNLKVLLHMYANAGGSVDFSPWKAIIDANNAEAVSKSKSFQEALKKAGRDKIMQKVQDEYFIENFVLPAKNYARTQYKSNAAVIVTADFFTQSSIANAKKIIEEKGHVGATEKDQLLHLIDEREKWLISIFEKNPNKERRELNIRQAAKGRMNLLRGIVKTNINLSTNFTVHGVTV
jgi:hypothetical protein|tara:strand:+ start:421 stop:1110 length:690 start_codon:yes stop_codon:yes gene_type:complete